METDAEKQTFSAFERFLYWFFIPIIFTMVLIGALSSLLDFSVVDPLLKIGEKVPGLSAILPDSKEDNQTPNPEASTPASKAEAKTADLEAEVSQLQQQLAAKETALTDAQSAFQAKEQEAKDLEAQVAALEDQLVQKALSDEEYEAAVKETASIYAKMSASKAAPIMENLTLEEQVLLLSAMKTDEQVRILQKMTPKAAAEASIYLKDMATAKDREIAALQSRLNLNSSSSASSTTSTGITKAELGETFASMSPDDAAALLLEMEKTNSAKVTEILNNMDAASRSKILTSISNSSSANAVAIAKRLAP